MTRKIEFRNSGQSTTLTPITVLVISLTIGFGQLAAAIEANPEKVKITNNRSVHVVKKTYRKIDDKICESINGHLKCLPKKLKVVSKTKGTSNKIKVDTTDNVNKIE